MEQAKVIALVENSIREMQRVLELVREGKDPAPTTKLTIKMRRGAKDVFKEHADVLAHVPETTQERWIAVYKDIDWINEQIHKCRAWCEVKAVVTRNWGQRINNWLSNTTKSLPSLTVDVSQDVIEQIDDLLDQAFQGQVPPRTKKRSADLAFKFKNIDNFTTHLQEILDNPRANPKASGWRSFIELCLLRHLEVIK